MKIENVSLILGTEEKECLNSLITFPTAVFSMIIYFHGDCPPYTPLLFKLFTYTSAKLLNWPTFLRL